MTNMKCVLKSEFRWGGRDISAEHTQFSNSGTLKVWIDRVLAIDVSGVSWREEWLDRKGGFEDDVKAEIVMCSEASLKALVGVEGLKDFLQSPLGAFTDWTSLPTFGGEEPADTDEIWSWDADSLLVGSCASELEIIPR